MFVKVKSRRKMWTNLSEQPKLAGQFRTVDHLPFLHIKNLIRARSVITECFVRLERGEYRSGYLWIEADADADGFFVIVRSGPSHDSTLLFSSWQSSLEALNCLLREREWLHCVAKRNS